MSAEEALRARLYPVFLEELDEHLQRLERGLEELRAAAPNVPDPTVADLFRAAHSAKGAAAAVGAGEVASICHRLEEVLSQVRRRAVEADDQVIAQMLRLVDSLTGAAARLHPRPQQPVDVPATPRQHTEPGLDSGTVRLSAQRLDALLARAGELITATHRSEQLVSSTLQASDRLSAAGEHWRRDREVLHRALAHTATDDPAVREALRRLDTLSRTSTRELERLTRTAAAHQAALRGLATGFAESLRQGRLVPFTEATIGLARMVRDLCAEQGKQARLVVDATQVEVDKQLVGTLHDVLGHVVRNAVVHGIETPAQRAAAGKAESGTVAVWATLRGGGIVVTVQDDGRGVDATRLLQRARELGVADPDTDETSAHQLVFRPGVTTTDRVTEAAGRGVGLDAVLAAVDKTGGTVAFESTPGVGSRLRITVPMTLSTLRVVLVRTADTVVALPASAIRRLVRADGKRMRLGGRDVLDIDETAVPIVPLAAVLGWNDEGRAETGGTGLLITVPEGSVILLGDDLVAEREVVLHSAPSRLRGMAVLLGTAPLEDGSLAPVLSPAVCVRVALSGRTREADVVTHPAQSVPLILLVEDTVTTRELERSILVSAGYGVVAAVDGQQAWEMLQARDFDAVVSDVHMPRMDGIALCRAIRGSREHPNLPVVLVTSLHSEADRRRGLEAGADAYLDKSGFDRAQLLETLDRLL